MTSKDTSVTQSTISSIQVIERGNSKEVKVVSVKPDNTQVAYTTTVTGNVAQILNVEIPQKLSPVQILTKVQNAPEPVPIAVPVTSPKYTNVTSTISSAYPDVTSNNIVSVTKTSESTISTTYKVELTNKTTMNIVEMPGKTAKVISVNTHQNPQIQTIFPAAENKISTNLDSGNTITESQD